MSDSNGEEGGESEAETLEESAGEDQQALYWRPQPVLDHQPYRIMPPGHFAGHHVVLHQLRRIKHLPDEAINLIGLGSGLAKADQYWTVFHPNTGRWHQIASLADPGYSDQWTLRGWVIPYAPRGSSEVIQHHPITMERDVMRPGLGIRPPNRAASESPEPRIRDPDASTSSTDESSSFGDDEEEEESD